MDAAPRYEYPNIVPCLVFPFDRPRLRSGRREPALVFARRGDIVLFAIESTREFGVGILDGVGDLRESGEYATLDLAARAFLAREACVQ